METNATQGVIHFGTSIPVENVQELASRNIKDVSHRYIRPEIKSYEVSGDESSQIPVIDMSKLLTSGNVGYRTEMEKLHQACKEWGFFQLTDHGATAAIEKMKVATQDFFKLPFEEKMVYAQLPNSLEGYGQAFVVSEDQKLDWSDILVLHLLPASARNMKFWPINPPSFRSSLDEYSLELHRICISLFELMATNLGVEFQKFVDMYQESTQTIRMNYYPPCSQADRVIGVAPHSDGSLLTLLVQVNDVEGLQISKNGEWIPVKPIPGAIIVNIGDILEIMSNGEYRSIEHRGVVNFHKERISIAAFHNPSSKATISPLPNIVKENGAAKYKTVNFEEYVKMYLGSRLDGKTMIDRVRICN